MRIAYGEPERFRHRIFALAGLRPATAQHCREDAWLLRSVALDRRVIVELGVAEGASAFSLRSTMRPDADLWLVDPFFPGALRVISLGQLVAHRLVGSVDNGTVHWVKARSQDAGRSWNGPSVDLLFVDADHAYRAVRADWDAWEPNLAPEAVVAFDTPDPRRWRTTGRGCWWVRF